MRRSPLTPIFDEEPRRGSIIVGNTPGEPVVECVFFDFSDAAQLDDWSSGATIVGGQLRVGSGTSASKNCLNVFSSVNMWVETTCSLFNASSNNAGFIVLRVGSSSGRTYRIGTFDFPWRIARYSGGVETVLVSGSGTPSPAAPYRIRAEIWNSTGAVNIAVYEIPSGAVGGTKILRASYTDTSVDRVEDGAQFAVGSWTSGFTLPTHDNIAACVISPAPGDQGLTWTFPATETFRVPDGVTTIYVNSLPTIVTAASDYTVTVTGDPKVVSLPLGSYTWTFNPPGPDTPYEWQAPDDAIEATFTARGAPGGGHTASGGRGAEVVCTYTPTGGTRWSVWPAKSGGFGGGTVWPGGGRGCTGNDQGAQGGGVTLVQPANDLVNHVTDIDDAIVVAGAGGGNNSWQGGFAGHGGYPDGTDGTRIPGTAGGLKGTQSAGGAGPGNPGTKGTGGPGVSHGAVLIQEGSGGGAGLYGGAASGHDANAAGGGGGSSKIHAGATLVSSSTGTSTAGQVVISLTAS